MLCLYAFVILIIGVLVGYLVGKENKEGFEHEHSACSSCGKPSPCGCPESSSYSSHREPDLSKYVLKSTVPPCPSCPDLSNYILKTEVPPYPDMSRYVLKSTIPRQQPVILDCSKCQKPKGECPPCPRARCPEVRCPEPVKCPGCSPCPRTECPPAIVKCKAEEYIRDPVRPFLAPLDFNTFGN